MNVFECIWMYLASFLPINIFQGWFLVTFWRFQPKEMFRTLAFEKQWNWYQAFHHPSAYLGSCQIDSRSRRNSEGWKIWFIIINIHSDVLTPSLVFFINLILNSEVSKISDMISNSWMLDVHKVKILMIWHFGRAACSLRKIQHFTV